MFKHSGKKIKVIAVVLTILGFVVSLLGAAAVLMYRGEDGVQMTETVRIVTAVLTLLLGAAGSYVCGLLLHSWGEVVEKTKENNYVLSRIAAHSKESAAYLSRDRQDK